MTSLRSQKGPLPLPRYAQGPLPLPRYGQGPLPLPRSQEVLDETPLRTFTFLRALALRPEIRSALEARGYTLDAHEQGWTLLEQASRAWRRGDTGAEHDQRARSATAELEAWALPTFRIGRAALAHAHPQHEAFVFRGFLASKRAGGVLPKARSHQGDAAIIVLVSDLLDRLDELEGSLGREGTREADRAALATLAARGVTPGERARVRGLLGLAMSLGPLPDGDAPKEEPDAHRNDLLALRAWYEDWAEVARVMIRRRDHLILLGLAKRKSPAAVKPPVERRVGT